ncbi:MAG: hypothetical protein ACQKBY_02605 [Verrucomicrobiales bacterium]
MIQLLALLQIVWVLIAPGFFETHPSALEASIRRGGDQAVEDWRRFEETKVKRMQSWGFGLACAVLILATTATIINDRSNQQLTNTNS